MRNINADALIAFINGDRFSKTELLKYIDVYASEENPSVAELMKLGIDLNEELTPKGRQMFDAFIWKKVFM